MYNRVVVELVYGVGARQKGFQYAVVGHFCRANSGYSRERRKQWRSRAESLINNSSQMPKLRVARQQKSFRFKGANIDLQEAARELNVQGILTGKILLRGDTLVVKMSLDDVEKDAQVWGQQFTKKISETFALQDEIADEVLQILKLNLAGESKKRPVKQTEHSDAYHLYLKGRFYWAKRTLGDTKKALQFYEQAIEKDPN